MNGIKRQKCKNDLYYWITWLRDFIAKLECHSITFCEYFSLWKSTDRQHWKLQWIWWVTMEDRVANRCCHWMPERYQIFDRFFKRMVICDVTKWTDSLHKFNSSSSLSVSLDDGPILSYLLVDWSNDNRFSFVSVVNFFFAVFNKQISVWNDNWFIP